MAAPAAVASRAHDTALDRIKAVVGPKGWTDDAAAMRPHLEDWRGLYKGKARLVVKPATTEEVAGVVAACHDAGIPIVPQGGNTSLCGGSTPDDGGEAIVLSLVRMNRVRDLDAANHTITVEAGCVLADVQSRAADADRYFPLSLAAEGSCVIGGNLSTNAGGTNVLKYGNARELVLGLEVVLRGRADLERPARPAQGQHRLRPEAAVPGRRGHPRDHHRGGAEAVPEADRRPQRVLRGAGHRLGRHPARPRPRRERRRRGDLRVHAAPGHGPRAEALPGHPRPAADPLRAVRPAGAGLDRDRRHRPRRQAGGDPGIGVRGRPRTGRRHLAVGGAAPGVLEAAGERVRSPEARGCLDQARRVGAGLAHRRVLRDGVRAGDGGRRRRPAGRLRPCRRRQPALQPAGSRGQRRQGVPGEMGALQPRGPRHGGRDGRFDQRRARDRPSEAQRNWRTTRTRSRST